jgi:hypothetical protein
MRAWRAAVIILVLPLPALVAGQGVGQEDATNGGGSSAGAVSRVPSGVILVKRAWSSASDSVTPLPEGGNLKDQVFRNSYFGMTYPLLPDWNEKYAGPPPSDRGLYVLAQLNPANTFRGPARGSILITAQDMFFASTPARNASEWVDYMKDHLHSDYKVETMPKRVGLADREFIFFGYWSPAADLHWHVLATEIRCHFLQIVLTSRDTKLLEDLMTEMNRMKLPAEASPTGGTGGGAVPVCIRNYAQDDNLIVRVDPVLTGSKFDRIPVRIIIGKEGEVKHIHFISASAEEAKAITDALGRWRFKPYNRGGQPIEVETGILFGQGGAR